MGRRHKGGDARSSRSDAHNDVCQSGETTVSGWRAFQSPYPANDASDLWHPADPRDLGYPADEGMTASGWRAYHRIDKSEAGGEGDEYGASEEAQEYMTTTEQSLFEEYHDLIKLRRYNEILPEQQAASAKQRRIHFQQSPGTRKGQAERVKRMYHDARDVRKYLEAIEKIKVGSNAKTVNNVYKAACSAGYAEDSQTLMRRSSRYKENPDNYRHSGEE